jgi:hypothetical protein
MPQGSAALLAQWLCITLPQTDLPGYFPGTSSSCDLLTDREVAAPTCYCRSSANYPRYTGIMRPIDSTHTALLVLVQTWWDQAAN